MSFLKGGSGLRIGIPRGLLYYLYKPLWEKFFAELGLEVVVSKKTTKNTFKKGIEVTVDDICLPVKIYHGHVISLKDNVDAVFIPRLVSIKNKEFICPKLMGLPDVIRVNIKDLPPIIDTTIDLTSNWLGLYRAVFEVGNYFTKKNTVILKAFYKAVKNFKNYTHALEKGARPDEILEGYCNIVSNKAKFKILLLGHPYNLYDPFINLNMIKKIENYGARVITPENFAGTVLIRRLSKLNKPLFWTLGNKLLSAAYQLKERRDIDGVILLASFGCGPDSLIGELIERWIRKNTDIPFALLTIDEHSGDAGLNTRIEAFMDMIERRKAT